MWLGGGGEGGGNYSSPESKCVKALCTLTPGLGLFISWASAVSPHSLLHPSTPGSAAVSPHCFGWRETVTLRSHYMRVHPWTGLIDFAWGTLDTRCVYRERERERQRQRERESHLKPVSPFCVAMCVYCSHNTSLPQACTVLLSGYWRHCQSPHPMSIPYVFSTSIIRPRFL